MKEEEEEDERARYKPIKYPYRTLKELNVYWGNKNAEKTKQLKKDKSIEARLKGYFNSIIEAFKPKSQSPLKV